MLHKTTPAQRHEVNATDLTSCFNMCRLVIGAMRERGFGRIVNISSINGQKGQLGQTHYAAAKAGIFGFAKSLALEMAPNSDICREI
jgi:acetoacetyl-CoA reductase